MQKKLINRRKKNESVFIAEISQISKTVVINNDLIYRKTDKILIPGQIITY